MPKRYLLPCSCGESISLDVAQAGQIVACSCGQTQQAPSLLKMKVLSTVEENLPSVAATASTFNAQFFFWFLGLLVLIPSLLFLSWAISTRPKPMDVLQKQVWFTYGDNKMVYQDSVQLATSDRDILSFPVEYIEQMSPFQVYLHFRKLRNGPVFSYNFQENYEMLKDAYRIRVSAAVICTALGLLCLAASVFTPRWTKAVGVRKGAEWK